METIVRRQTSFRLSEELLERLKIEANKVNRSLNSFVENALMELVYKRPNQATMDAIKEAQSGEELETLDLENFKEYVAKLYY
jgi:predicted transcriptional regulator